MVFTDISPMTCLMGAQPELAKWVNQNPKFKVHSWRCRTVSFAEFDA